MVNLTTVYGELLNQNDIDIKIPLDAEYDGLFEFNFVVGDTDIEPSYESTANTPITSGIEFIFSKSFEDDLGTGKSAGEEVASLPIAGLTFPTGGKLTCKIYPSVSTITYPTIICTGYNKIKTNTQVTIMIDGLKSLPSSTSDYIKVGVSYTYFNHGGVKGYIYEPTGFVVQGTSAKVTPKTYTFSVTESSSTLVGELVDYSFSGTVQSGFSSITDTDYLVVEFD